MYASEENAKDAVEILLKNNADIHMQNKKVHLLLMMNEECVLSLLLIVFCIVSILLLYRMVGQR